MIVDIANFNSLSLKMKFLKLRMT